MYSDDCMHAFYLAAPESTTSVYFAYVIPYADYLTIISATYLKSKYFQLHEL